MSVITNIQQKYDKLTVSQKKVADYIVMNEKKSAMQTSTEICMDAEVSGSTVIRLAYALGYKSFAEMQRQLKNDILADMAAPAVAKSSHCLQSIIDEEISILTEMRNGMIDHDQLRRIAEKLLDADRVIILGYFGEHTASFQLYLLLDTIRPNVFYFRQNNAGYREAMQLTEKSVVVASSFAPYAPGTLRLFREMKAYGSYLIAFSDSKISDICREADESVIVRLGSRVKPDINRTTPLIILFHAIYSEMLSMRPEESMQHFQTMPSQLTAPTFSKAIARGLGPIANEE